MTVPSDTRSLLEELEKLYPDKYEVEVKTPEEYWKRAGIIELLRLIRYEIGDTKFNNINARK